MASVVSNLGFAMFFAIRAWLPLIHSEAKLHHVDALTLAVIVWHESRGDPSAYFLEHDGACSIGLGGVRVPGCEPGRAALLRDPAANLAAAAYILQANEEYCRRHKRERQCRAGEKVFRGGGAVNHYGGSGTAYAHQVLKLRHELAPYFNLRAASPGHVAAIAGQQRPGHHGRVLRQSARRGADGARGKGRRHQAPHRRARAARGPAPADRGARREAPPSRRGTHR